MPDTRGIGINVRIRYLFMSRKIEVVRKKAPVVERGPHVPQKQKVVVLRRVRENEEYIHKDEIPVSIGIPRYFNELKAADEAREREIHQFEGKTIIFIIGGPGSGKGTQSQMIIENYDTGYMSAGDLLRAEADTGSELGNFIQEQMKLGAIVPQEITIGLLKKEILNQSKQLYLIDGFPRKLDQAQTFEETVCQAACALFLDVPDDVLVERLMERGKESGRVDDNPETIKLRLKTFHEVSEPVYDMFDAKGKAIKIDGNRPTEEIFADIKKLLDRILSGGPVHEPEPEEEEEVAEVEPETK